jgi:ABC-type polysaccharide/polyol phosphate transport system ATPase subunit
VPEAATAIEVRGLEKAFRIPTHRVDSLKERIVRPFSARDYRELRALDGISFEIHQGEFFGIVGRNGSGKSTLLKLLASIYRADAGTIRMAGRLAPFIELGVGFNVELTARENIVLNGVMMGLTPAETRHRLDAMIDFAELRDFADLKLKNYSSGMLVRLAFSVMMHADADIMLIDEVLAVGDAAFQQKCADAFRQMKAEGKTIVLVTHEMSAVEEYCHRSMLIDRGKIRRIGDPAEVGREYMRLNFEQESSVDGASGADGDEVRVRDIWIEDAAGERATTVEHGKQIVLRAELEALGDLSGLGIGFIVANVDGVAVFEFGRGVTDGDGALRAVSRGERVQVRCTIENPLSEGRYFVHCGVNLAPTAKVLSYIHNAIDFMVLGGAVDHGVVYLEHSVETRVEGGG